MALIYVPKRRSGFTVMRAAGEYDKDGKKASLFARGDIFIRIGTSSERVTQETFNQRVLALLEEASSPAEISALNLGDLPDSVEVARETEIWSMRRPQDFNPPGDAGAHRLVIRAQVGLQAVEREVLIDSQMRNGLIQTLPLSPIDLYVGELSYGMQEWMQASWVEAGFNNVWALTVERRPAASVVPPQFWARACVAEPHVAHPNAHVDVLVDAVYVPGRHYSNISGTMRQVGFEKTLPIRNAYDLLHAAMATGLKIGYWLEQHAAARRDGTPYLAVYIESGNEPLSNVIDFGQVRQVQGSSFSPAAWEARPTGLDTTNVEERDRFIKLWLKKTMIAGGLRDFEYQLDAFVPRHWPL